MADQETKRVFLSYSSEDKKEVDPFELELRRRGLPLWRDRHNLLHGRLTSSEIENACREASGFVFYLSKNAARSDWVRERELEHALDIAPTKPSLGIVPVFRESIEEIIRILKDQGARDPERISGYHGYVMDPLKIKQYRAHEELRPAADAVFGAFLHTLRENNPSGSLLRIGVATRGGAALRGHQLDLLLDWTEDYGNEGNNPPNPKKCATVLKPALQSLWKGVTKNWPKLAVRFVPQCHLSMALALGFRFGRNSGVTLEVVNPYDKEEVWKGPHAPREAAMDAWNISIEDEGQGEMVVAVCISRPAKTVKTGIDKWIRDKGMDVGMALYFEPKEGTSNRALLGRKPYEVHAMACAVVQAMVDGQGQLGNRNVHLFIVGPPGLAVLIGQQLPNAGHIQTYEWVTATNDYEPCFVLKDAAL